MLINNYSLWTLDILIRLVIEGQRHLNKAMHDKLLNK